MSKTFEPVPSGMTPVPTTPSLAVQFDKNNYSADWNLVEDSVGKVVYSNNKAPLDQPMTLRVAQQSRSNVYAGSSIDVAMYASNKTGTDTIFEVKGVGEITDSADASYRKLVPWRAALTFTTPNIAEMNEQDMYFMAELVLASLYVQGSDGTEDTGLEALLRGALYRK